MSGEPGERVSQPAGAPSESGPPFSQAATPIAGPQLQRKTNPNGHEFIRGINRGMLFWALVTRQHAVGSEHYHDTPTLFVIVSNDRIHQRLPVVYGVPLTSNLDAEGDPNGPFRQHRIRVLKEQVTRFTAHSVLDYIDRLALTEHGRELAHERLCGQPVGRLLKPAMSSVEAGLRYALHIPP